MFDDYSSFGEESPGPGLSQIRQGIEFKTLNDLYRAIMTDGGLSPMDRQQMVQQIRSQVNAPDSTPLASILRMAGGGAIGYLISRYFGMGPVGQLMASAVGMGIGRMMGRGPGGGLRTIGG